MPAPPSDTERPPPDGIMAAIADLMREVQTSRREVLEAVADLRMVVGALETKVELVEKTGDAARAAARVAAHEAERSRKSTDAVAFMLDDKIGGGLSEIDRKLDESIHRLTTVISYNAMQIQTLFEQAADHAALPADEAHGRRYRNGNGNGHDPDIEILSAE